MAFGSSAPEIILSTLEAVKELGKPAGDLGPSTIVGSAAFNLLVISGVSILAVDDIKKIDDMGVFFTTATFSLFAYVWLFMCLQVNTPGRVTVTEAGWTFGFFFILLVIAVSADKYRQIVKKKE
jgi:solute carrier family 8 (sodium/calcium exchanger)